jgi:DMSO/TMAO reductase YedYZ molybdopterin-dependent catalytic subunit
MAIHHSPLRGRNALVTNIRYNVLVDDRTIGRGAFLGALGLGALGLVWGRQLSDAAGRVIPNFVPQLGSKKGWRIYTIGDSLPTIDPVSYRLQVEGLVERPLSLSLADLRAMPRARQISDFHCVTGWSVDDVHWGGVRFKDVLAAAGAKPEARWLRFISVEVPYTDNLSVPQALLPDVMLAFNMDGAPLSKAHGAPVRVVMPQMYGYKSVKWVERIEVRRDFVPGFWETHGYDSDAWIGRSNGLGV